jgi:ribosomal protein S18 acetylase RimI-like enzyme
MELSSAIVKIPSVQHKRLTLDHIIKPFDCNNTRLNEFLLNDSKEYLHYLLSVTYLLETPDKTIAYYTLANDLLCISANTSREFKSLLRKRIKSRRLYEMFNWEEFPSVKIGRLAIDVSYQSIGIGTELLNAIIYGFLMNNKTGCAFITVDALNTDRTIRFYIRNGFIFLTDRDKYKESRLMYRCLI